MNNKKVIFCIVIFFVCFLIIYYIFYKSGNNKVKKFENRTIEEIFGDFDSYSADVRIEVKSNKTINYYDVKEIVKNGESEIDFEDGKLKIINKDGKIIINTKENNHEKNYKIREVFNNNLFLNVAIEELKGIENINIEEKVEEYIIKYKNTYGINKEIYIDKESNLPKKMYILNDVQKIEICIEYKYIEIK